MNLDNVRFYANYVLIFCKNAEVHAMHLEKVCRIMKNNGLRLRAKKFSFMQSCVELIWHIGDKIEVDLDEQKVEKVRDAMLLTIRKELP